MFKKLVMEKIKISAYKLVLSNQKYINSEWSY